MLKKIALFVMIIGSLAVAQQQAKTSRTVSYFMSNDPNLGELLEALEDDPTCEPIDVDVYEGYVSASFKENRLSAGNIDVKHETWWLSASPKTFSGYKKYRYNYVLSPPGALTLENMIYMLSDKTARGLARQVCMEVTKTPRGARIHGK